MLGKPGEDIGCVWASILPRHDPHFTRPNINADTAVNYLSVCSGIEAASVAWHDFGWNPVAFAEIEKFPSAVLAHHFPYVPNLGDMTKFHDWPKFNINLLVGGTPCQAFSVAGLRQGLADPRGNLTLTYLAVAAKYRPEWLVWENVPGVLSDRTNAFGQFLAGLAELGYGWAYRMLDAQYFGVAQRRKRVFVVAHLGDWQRAAAVLFEPESMRGDNPPSRETRKEITGTLGARTQGGGGLGTDFDICGGCIPIQEPGKRTGRSTSDRSVGIGIGAEGDSMYTLQAGAVHGVAHTLKAEGFDASEDGTGRGTPLIPVVSPTITSNYGKQVDSSDTSKGPNVIIDRWPASVAPTLNAHFGSKQGLEDQHALGGGGLFVPAVAFHPTQDPISSNEVTHGLGCGSSTGQASIAVAFQQNQLGEVRTSEIAGTINTNSNASGRNTPMALAELSVRRLTPMECERLQGFPDGFTDIPWRTWQEAERKDTSYESLLLKRGMKLRGPNVEICPDGPRYKALGNSMAVPCMRWIGNRIKMFAGAVTEEDWS